MQKEYYRSSSRAEYSFQEYPYCFDQTVLDVGSGGSVRFFKGKLGDRYVAADVSSVRNEPDVIVNFERETLPFKDGQFETVLCFDCLEHCDDIYDVFDELARVSSRYVVISLPNNWPGFIWSLLKGHHFTHTRGYGLPGKKAPPGDRHKWWFNIEEAESFVREQAERNNLSVKSVRYVFEPGDSFIKLGSVYPNVMKVQPRHFGKLAEIDSASAKNLGRPAQMAATVARKIGPKWAQRLFGLVRLFVGYPIYLIDELLKRAIWGWGSKFRYLNLFCRQFWVVLEKDDVEPPQGTPVQ